MKSRNRFVYALLIIFVIFIGLASRKFSMYLPTFLSKYSGDALWALMIFLIIGFILNKSSTKRVAVYALLFSFSIEISQLYHAPWIDAIRHTTLGALVLGFGFLWSDLICYAAGITIGALTEKLYRSKK